MRQVIDLTGQEFQGCKVIARAGRDKTGNALWQCICKCGRIVVKRTDHLRKNGASRCNRCSNYGKTRIYRIRNEKLTVREFSPEGIKPEKAIPCEKCGADSIPFSKVLTKDNKKYNRLCRPCFVGVC